MAELARVSADKLQPGASLRLDVGEEGICLVRIGDDFYAISDRCSHANVSLCEGDVDEFDRTVECWKHGSTFSLIDGQPQCLPATQPVKVFQVSRDGDDVVVSER